MKIITKCLLIFLISGCANIVMPDGGGKDISPPQILKIKNIINENKKGMQTISFEFDEYFNLNKWEEYFYTSPPTNKRLQPNIKGKTLLINIDEELNVDDTYYFSLNYCIKDNNEGNILDTLSYTLAPKNIFDTLSLSGNLVDAYTLMPQKNAWVLLYKNTINDSLIFNSLPNYIAKTDKNGLFNFPNLKNREYKIVSITGLNFNYDNEEKIAFLDRLVNAKNDTFISLLAFNPNIDKTKDSLIYIADTADLTLTQSSVDKKEKNGQGNLELVTNISSSCIFQLLQNEKVIKEVSFDHKPYIIDSIPPGNYQIKYISDENNDDIWNTGNWDNKILPEKVKNYASEITIRANWDLELEWTIIK